MSAITFRGPWPWAWVAWGAVRTGVVVMCVVAATIHGDLPTWARLTLDAAYILFAVLEGVGAWRLKHNPTGVEIIKTWSQLNQWLGQGFGRWIRSVALMNAAVDAFAVYIIFEVLHPIPAALLAGLLFWHLAPHFNDRSDAG